MQKKALIILCVLVLTSSGYAAPPAHAAIPVIDVDNITQQLKTYQETVKVVTNTKEQVELQWKELKKLPSQILNGYKTSLINGWNKIQDILTKNGTVIYGTTGTISDKGVPDLATAHTIYINDYFSKNIPSPFIFTTLISNGRCFPPYFVIDSFSFALIQYSNKSL